MCAAQWRWPLALGLCLTLVVGCGSKDDRVQPPISAEGPSAAGVREPARNTGKEQPLVLTARDLFAEGKKDPAAAKAKFEGKVLEVSGVVARLAHNRDAKMSWILLDVGERTQWIWCSTVDLQPWQKACPGQPVKIRGTGTDWTDPMSIKDCLVIEVGPNPAPVISAADLVKEYTASAEAAETKYLGRYLIVIGEVASSADDSALFQLQSDGKREIRCAYDPDMTPGAALKPGQKVKVFGKHVSENPSSIRMDDCLLLPN